MNQFIVPFSNFKAIAFFTFIILFNSVLGLAQEDLKLKVSPKDIDKVFSDWDHPDKAGIAVGIISNGEIIYKKGYGSANLEHRIPINSSTKFHVGALANQFIAFSVLLLQEEAKFSLQDDIRKYIPELPEFGKTIRIAHLLYHTSGLQDISILKQIATWQEEDALSQKQVFDLMHCQKVLLNEPGKTYRYNPIGMMLLEELISRVSGQNYRAYVKTNIFDPLKMPHTVFENTGSSILENRATGYTLEGNRYKKNDLNFSADLPSPLYTTIDDLCKWMLNFRTPKIGNGAIFQQLESPALVNGKAVKPANAALKFGQHRMWDFKGTNKLYIIGMAGGYACKLVRFPDQDFSVVVLGNEAAYNGYTSSIVADLFLEKYYDLNSPSSTSAPKYVKLATAKLKTYEGSYWNQEGFYSRKIYLKNDTLRYLREDSGYESNLLPLDDTHFQMQVGAKIIVEFVKDGKDKLMKVAVNDAAAEVSTAYNRDADWTKNLFAFTGDFYCEALANKYTIKKKGNQLVVSNLRMAEIELKPILKQMFASNIDFFKTIEFERNENDSINGFWLSSPGINKLWFKRIRTKNKEGL